MKYGRRIPLRSLAVLAISSLLLPADSAGVRIHRIPLHRGQRMMGPDLRFACVYVAREHAGCLELEFTRLSGESQPSEPYSFTPTRSSLQSVSYTHLRAHETD